MSLEVMTPISLGELVDKITILEIKSEQIIERARLRNIRYELSLLVEVRDKALGPLTGSLATLAAEIKEVNKRIWDAEDAIHGMHRVELREVEFLRSARIAFEQNDRRARLKRRINDMVGSAIVEEKSYADFGSDTAVLPTGSGS